MIFIYLLVDPITDEIKYVGKTNEPLVRLRGHLVVRNTKKRKDAWIKSLKDKKLKPVVEIIDEVVDEEWEFWEQYYISLFRSWGFNLYNLTNGGEGVDIGHIPWNKGKTGVYSEEHLERMRNRKVSKETKEKIKAARAKQVISKEGYKKSSEKKKGKKPPYMEKLSPEEISKLRNSGNFKKGSTPWNVGKKGYSTSKKGTKVPEDKIKKRPVKQIDPITKNVIAEFPSVKEAKLKTGFTGISLVLTGRNKTAGGYIWE